MKLNILYWLVIYDAWCEGQVESLLRWLEEWFSISQKRAEESMIVIYLALMMIATKWTSAWIGADIAEWILVGSVMGWLHWKPVATRGGARRYPEMGVLRAFLQGCLFFVAGTEILILPHCASNICNGIALIVYLVFFYMTDINSNGKPGRRRKLALAELKKLFGTVWLPKPVLAPEYNDRV